MELLLGIDGGGSKTASLISDADGTLLGRGTAGSSNYQSVGFAAASAAIQAATTTALQSAGLDARRPIAAACLGLAGADRPTDQARFAAWLREQAQIAQWTITNDAELVLQAGTPASWGVALICGTGSICFGRAPDGRSARAGGWGHLIGDEGSGYALGVGALRLATQTADGRADAQAVLAAILAHWRLTDSQELVSYVYSPTRTRADIAVLAPLLVALADHGDGWAQEVVAQAAHELGRLISAVVRRLDLHEPPVALGGGLIGASASLQHAITAQTGIVLGSCVYVAEPAHGALKLARGLLQQPP